MIDRLNGRELDAKVAEHVFGLKVEERTNARTSQKDYVYAIRPEGANTEWVRVAFYSANMAASVNLGIELQSRGWKRKETRVGGERSESKEERLVLEHADGRTVEAVGPVNVALRRAALRAMGL